MKTFLSIITFITTTLVFCVCYIVLYNFIETIPPNLSFYLGKTCINLTICYVLFLIITVVLAESISASKGTAPSIKYSAYSGIVYSLWLCFLASAVITGFIVPVPGLYIVVMMTLFLR